MGDEEQQTVESGTALREDPFGCLPPELCVEILNCLEFPDILRAQVVSTQWKYMCDSEALWHHIASSRGIQSPETGFTTWKELCMFAFSSFKGSAILNWEQKKLLVSWLGASPANHYWKLQYRGTRDGMRVQEFHEHVDRLSHSVCIARSVTGNVFGGYSPVTWDLSVECDMCDPLLDTAFIFILRNLAATPPVKLHPVAREDAVVRTSWAGALWGRGFDLGLLGHPNDREPSAWCRIGKTYKLPSHVRVSNAHNVINGSRDFGINELEVFSQIDAGKEENALAALVAKNDSSEPSTKEIH
eukprot:TRINITY_DN15411_c0_g1_i1.p1 TRINITY_DN15411_c0_g1~~TRINITY_DN15411_c0_g1_i1.p1  ORF type:complete len:301 (+),score=30.87 TRINITY_DN15411_c0_g1_i1:166-1068(+)